MLDSRKFHSFKLDTHNLSTTQLHKKVTSGIRWKRNIAITVWESKSKANGLNEQQNVRR